RWLAPIKPHLKHLAAASSASSSLEANLKHIIVILATWDAVWEPWSAMGVPSTWWSSFVQLASAPGEAVVLNRGSSVTSQWGA
ncbi:hypothetical protein HaLaN_28355, partial [Haematococcus lacustris]